VTAAIVAIVFLVLFALILLVVSLGVKVIESERKKRVTGILRTASGEAPPPETSIITDPADADQVLKIPMLMDLPFFKRMETNIQQAGLTWSPSRVVVLTVLFAVLGAFLGSRVAVPVFREFAMAIFACALGALPYLYVLMKRRKRLNAFEELFPEALDFLARSMRAGHAFSVSLEMMADESPDPIGVEFRKVFHETNLGAPLDVALRNLAARVPLLDVRFFVSAVLLQRETGGNLAEILTNLAFIIRERFRLKGQVRAASAHGRLTATVLSVMPILTMLGLLIMAPGYLQSMASDSDGKYLIIGSIVAQFVGYYWMKKIIDIKV
jgi:tight adherence protein B